MEDLPQNLGRYEVKSLIGRGAMGNVYLAFDSVLGRDVAVKTIRADLALTDTQVADLRDRFDIEARAAAGLAHPVIITVHDFGREGDTWFIVMEYAEGESLGAILESGGGLALAEVANLTRQLADALDFAHAQGVIHRDVKPANVIVGSRGQLKLVDFGVAKLPTSALTVVGTVLGSPAYMSPEQVRGEEVDEASDQFSLAVIVYRLLTGILPFDGDSASTIMYKIVNERPHPPSALIAAELEPVLHRALEKDAAARYPSCSAFATELGQILEAASKESVPGAAQVPDALVDANPGLAATILMEPAAYRTADPGPTVPFDVDATVVDKAAPRDREPPDPPPPQSGAWDSQLLGQVGRFSPRTTRLMALSAGVIAVAALVIWFQPASEPPDLTSDPAIDVGATAPGTGAIAERSWWVDVNPYPPDASIWLNGRDTGLRAPAALEIRGRPGDRAELELTRAGARIAAIEFTLGATMPGNWPAEPLVSVLTETAEPARPPATKELAALPSGVERTEPSPRPAVTEAAAPPPALKTNTETAAPPPAPKTSIVKPELVVRDRTSEIDRARESSAALVAIDFLDGNNSALDGVSGVVVGESGVIATCLPASVGQSAQVYMADGNAYRQVIVQAVDRLHGVMLLRVPGFELAVAALGDSRGVAEGTSLVVGMQAPQQEPEFRLVLAAEISTATSKNDLRTISRSLSDRACGGPVFDAAGTVVGMLVRTEASESMSYLPIHYVRGLLAFPATETSIAALDVELSSSPGGPGVASADGGGAAANDSLALPRPLSGEVGDSGQPVEDELRAQSDADPPARRQNAGEGASPGDLHDGTVPLTAAVTRPQLIAESVRFEMTTEGQQVLNFEQRLIVIRCLVRSDGSVAQAKLYRIAPDVTGFDNTKANLVRAIEKGAVNFWRFKPAILDGQPVSVWSMVSVKLEPAGSPG